VHTLFIYLFYKSQFVNGKVHAHISMPFLCVRNISTSGPRSFERFFV